MKDMRKSEGCGRSGERFRSLARNACVKRLRSLRVAVDRAGEHRSSACPASPTWTLSSGSHTCSTPPRRQRPGSLRHPFVLTIDGLLGETPFVSHLLSRPGDEQVRQSLGEIVEGSVGLTLGVWMRLADDVERHARLHVVVIVCGPAASTTPTAQRS